MNTAGKLVHAEKHLINQVHLATISGRVQKLKSASQVRCNKRGKSGQEVVPNATELNIPSPQVIIRPTCLV
jgi:hypothetical protein